MAKYIIILEDTDISGQPGEVDINIHELLRADESARPGEMTTAGRLARYLELKLLEMELAIQGDRERRMASEEEAARCWH